MPGRRKKVIILEPFHFRVLDCPNWELEKKRKLMDILQLKLEKEKNTLEKKQRERRLRWEILHLKTEIIKQILILFEKYFQVYKKSWDYSFNLSENLTNEISTEAKKIQKLNAECDLLGRIRSNVKDRCHRVQGVKIYMATVQKSAPDYYSSINDIITRFDFLYKTRERYIHRILDSEEMMEQFQNFLAKSNIELADEQLALEKKVIELEQELDKRQIELNATHDRLVELKDGLINTVVVPHILESGISNIYHQTCEKISESQKLDENEPKPIEDQIKLIEVAYKEILGMLNDAHIMNQPVSDFGTANTSSSRSIIKPRNL